MNWLASLVTGRRSKWIVIVVWLLGASALVPFSSKLAAVEQNSQASFVPSGAPSTVVSDLESRFPDLNRLAALVVLYRAEGLSEKDLAYADSLRSRIDGLSLVGASGVSPVAVSAGRRGAILEVALRAGTSATAVATDINRLRSALTGPPPGVSTGVGGPAAVLTDTASVFSGIDGVLLLATVLVVTVLLLLTYRSVSATLSDSERGVAERPGAEVATRDDRGGMGVAVEAAPEGHPSGPVPR